jgi:hypothetical protein
MVMKNFNTYLITLVVGMAMFFSSCGRSDVAGVYGGFTTTVNLVDSSIDRSEMVLLLRKDGTFTDDLTAPDWETTVKGKYTVNASTLKLVYLPGNNILNYTINENGSISKDGSTLLRMNEANSIPAGNYQFRPGNVYYLDGEGRFSSAQKGASFLTGINITDNKFKTPVASGNYTARKGQVDFSFENGRKETHYFYTRREPGTGRLAAVIDGRFYITPSAGTIAFEEDEDDNESESAPTETETRLPSAAEIIDTLRSKYGGQAIDQVRTIQAEAMADSFQIRSYIDLPRQRMRFEILRKDSLLVVEQLQGKEGWRWAGGKLTSLEADRIAEIRLSPYTGIPGLGKSFNEPLLSGNIERATHGYNLGFDAGGYHFIYVIDTSFSLLGYAYKIGGIEQAGQFRNFKTVSGITLPFVEETYRDGQTNTIKYTRYLVNAPLKTNWRKPLPAAVKQP